MSQGVKIITDSAVILNRYPVTVWPQASSCNCIIEGHTITDDIKLSFVDSYRQNDSHSKFWWLQSLSGIQTRLTFDLRLEPVFANAPATASKNTPCSKSNQKIIVSVFCTDVNRISRLDICGLAYSQNKTGIKPPCSLPVWPDFDL